MAEMEEDVELDVEEVVTGAAEEVDIEVLVLVE